MKPPLRHWDRGISLTFMLLLLLKKWSNYNISSYHFKHKSMKSLSFKYLSDGQSDIHTTIKCVIIFLQIIKNWVRLNKTLKLKFILMLFNSVYPIHPSDNVTKYTVYLPILLVEWLFKWSFILFCYFILCLWLAKPGSKNLCILLFEIEYCSSLFLQIPSFRHQDSSSYYLVVATAKIPKN